MKRKAVVALLACVALAATGCGNSEKETEKVTTEAVTEATTEAASETESETTAETESETATEAASETESETATEEKAESETVTEAESETETESETATKAESETETESETATEAESETETESETVTEAESETGTEENSEAESETESESEFNIADMPEYEVSDYLTLGEYKGLTVEVAPVEAITDEQVMAQIVSETKQTLTEGTVEEGDTVNIDYVGKLDGEAFDGGSKEGDDLEIGSHSFIDGFEDGIIGMQVGETKDLNLTFPENYHNEDLAGKDVVFTVTVNSITRVPELTDEVANSVVEGMTAEAYQESVREELETSAEEAQKEDAEQQLLQMAADNAELTGYPEEALQYTINRALSYYEAIAARAGMTLEQLYTAYGLTEDSFMEQLQPVAETALKQEMTLIAIAEAENMEVSDEEYQNGLEKYAAAQGNVDPSKLEETYGEAYIRNSILQEKALEFLYDNAVIEEVKETESEETEVVSEAESDTEQVTDAESEAATESESETGSETETESESDTETETETEA